MAQPSRLCSLGDDLLLNILQGVPLSDRLRSVALTSRHLRALTTNPALLEVVAVEYSPARAPALLRWLALHARHVQHLKITSRKQAGLAALPQQGGPQQVALAASCLTAACAAAPLAVLELDWSAPPMHTVAWLPFAGATLTRLDLDARAAELHIDTCLGGMEMLRSAAFKGARVTMARGAKLPAALTMLRFVNMQGIPRAAAAPHDSLPDLPEQVATLSQLADLRITCLAVLWARCGS
ncbi:hypothetical protein CHLNCDRAFT_141625 [Chlorella variabilis]|uniref:F-box domain-containing protein n=1 Tax=Chlorella variabilis TaxID=554065 RepID=E1ZT70_CHLVA|nr:hypothetical protein CHLNCDRAFT_141625 [Chlorella variabilis]EFN50949.1 hypothetical protein CHLNCDRAFT_141625 [Chlorella variabilis]|eukprot:XP_005843051.1 hypothetical protein CHLNCDRAFT_141625 [Chlorella variabilis]